MEVVSPMGQDRGRHLSQQSKNDRDVVRSEAPENVFLTANFSEVQSVGVDVLDASEFSALDQVFKFEHSGMVPEQMTDHQDPALFSRQGYQGLSFFGREAQRLFDKHILAGKQ